MHLSTLLEMASDASGDRVAFGPRTAGLTYAELLDRAHRAGAWIAARRVQNVGLVDVNSEAVPILIFGCGYGGVPFAPISYRLADEQLRAILAHTAPSVIVVENAVLGRVGKIDGVELVERETLLPELEGDDLDVGKARFPDPDDIAILLFTSGTTGDPKAALLRHKHLASYVINTVEFMCADATEAALVSVPPYHVAGISAVLTCVYSGRRVVYLPAFSAEAWVTAALDEAVTHAMLVPTMLARILHLLDGEAVSLPHLRHLSYGGGRMPIAVIERAMRLLPHVDFVNAYGLTETSSTIAVLGPDDHRAAIASEDPPVRRRLASVGRPLPALELQIRDDNGERIGPGETGQIWVRGEQVAGEYLGGTSVVGDGWFPTRDAGSLDEEGYLYLEGRLDDVIVRGGENLSPGEIEAVLIHHPAVADAAVVGIPDTEWGEKVVAAVVLVTEASATEPELKDWVRTRLRSSKTPEHIAFRDSLPHNEMGKLLRRVLKHEFTQRT